MEVGDRVLVEGMGGEIAFIGNDLAEMPKGTWVGVVYDEPVGKNDGTVKGRRLFQCKKNHGHLLRPEKVKVCFAETAMKREARGTGGPAIGHAARSHELNARYMEDFNTAYSILAQQASDPSELHAGGGADSGCAPPPPLLHFLFLLLLCCPHLAAGNRSWLTGPADPQGTLVDVSDRPNTSISVRGSEAVVASTDHALYAIDLVKGVQTRRLYTKTSGHTEWVTCVAHLNDGRVVSGGMDSKVCVWNASGARCVDLKGHTGSITDIKVTPQNVVVSASYDTTIGVWDCSRHPSRALTTLLRGHQAAVTCLSLGPRDTLNAHILSGARDGVACLWDLGDGAVSRSFPGHGGHVTSSASLSGAVFMTGAQDGKVRVWDSRQSEKNGLVHSVPAHVLPHGAGAVGNMCVTSQESGGEFVITAGADGRVQVLESRTGFQPVHTLTGHKTFIYSLALAGSAVLSADGDGMLLVHEWATGRLCYGLGANAAAVRCIGVAELDACHKLVTSGDDGKVLIYDYH